MTDLNEGGTPTFQWKFLAADGWVLADFATMAGFSAISGGYTSPGFTQEISSDVYSNGVELSGFSTQTAGTKTVRLTITPVVGLAKTILSKVILVENEPPTIVRFDVSPEIVVAGVESSIEAIATDPEGDYLTYSWSMENVADIPTTGLTSNPLTITPNLTRIMGTVVVYDQYGASGTLAIPPVLITSSVDLAGTVNVPFLYVPRSMSQTTGTFTIATLPSGLSFLNGTVTGTPLVVGVTETTLGFTSPSGSDERALTFSIVTLPDAPLTPTNLRINGDGTNPRYIAAQDVIIQWTITSDGGEIPGSIVEIRTISGELKYSTTMAKGVDILSLSSAAIISLLGGYSDFVVRVFAYRASVKSVFSAETRVVYSF